MKFSSEGANIWSCMESYGIQDFIRTTYAGPFWIMICDPVSEDSENLYLCLLVLCTITKQDYRLGMAIAPNGCFKLLMLAMNNKFFFQTVPKTFTARYK